MKNAFCFKTLEPNLKTTTVMDSGVECESSFKSLNNSQRQNINAIEIKPDEVIRDINVEQPISRFVPFEMFLTGSKISVRLYSNIHCDGNITNTTESLRKLKQKRQKLMDDPTLEESDSSYHHYDRKFSASVSKKHTLDVASDIGYEGKENLQRHFL